MPEVDSEAAQTFVAATVPVSDPAAQGKDTTEWKAFSRIFWVGMSIVLTGGYEFLSALRSERPEMAWVGVALVLVGGAMKVFSALGYTKSRTLLKLAQLAPGPEESPTRPQ